LRFAFEIPGKGVRVRKVDKKTLKPVGTEIEIIGNLCMAVHTPSDYLVFCVAAHYDLRSFDDFEADCCLVIKDVKAFSEKLLLRVFEQVPDWVAKVDAVDYLARKALVLLVVLHPS
jgi:hypothetical protein